MTQEDKIKIAELEKEIRRLEHLLKAHKLEIARLREALHIQDFEGLI